MKAFGNKQLSELVKGHSFWDTQPVLKAQELSRQTQGENPGAIKTQTLDEVRKEPLDLPAGFVWGTIDLTGDADLEEVIIAPCG